ncbi:hydrogenase, putative [Leishmania guyanensis]
MDYIAPSTACIKPTLISSGGNNAVGSAGPTASTSGAVGMKRGGNALSHDPGIPAAAQHPDVVKITLQDCLACSGCVTTAETVLVNAQSRHEIVSALLTSPSSTSSSATGMGSAYRPRLVSISTQSCASLAAHLQMPVATVYELVAGFVRTALTTAALQEAQRNAAIAAAGPLPAVTGNAKETKLSGEMSGAPQTAAPDAATTAFPNSEPAVFVIDLEWAEQLSAELTAQEYDRRRRGGGNAEVGPLPLIVSACPGWVCYCEKQGSALLPHLCPVMSAQGIAGSYAKRTVAADLYHVSIQPCFDRKLEAARDSMALATAPLTEKVDMQVFYTDCVLSTAELLEWMKEVDPTLPWRGQLDTDITTTAAAALGGDNCTSYPAQQPTQLNEEELSASAPPPSAPAVFAPAHDATRFAGSGGYHQSVIAHRLQAERAATLPPSLSSSPNTSTTITYEVRRNRNHQLATCAALPGEVFCIGYGFQQIQNVVRGLKKRMPAMRSYTFIELMACPDGCLNGGGQVRPTQQPHTETLDIVLDAYARHIEVSRGRSSLPAATAATPSGSALACVSASPYCDGGDEQAENREDAMKAQRPRIEAAQQPFANATIAATAPSLGDALWRCTFRDREKEFAEMLNDGNVHRLKW